MSGNVSCPAAEPDDTSACDGPDYTVIVGTGAHAEIDGCDHHTQPYR